MTVVQRREANVSEEYYMCKSIPLASGIGACAFVRGLTKLSDIGIRGSEGSNAENVDQQRRCTNPYSNRPVSVLSSVKEVRLVALANKVAFQSKLGERRQRKLLASFNLYCNGVCRRKAENCPRSAR